jgi:hypothetical protein
MSREIQKHSKLEDLLKPFTPVSLFLNHVSTHIVAPFLEAHIVAPLSQSFFKNHTIFVNLQENKKSDGVVVKQILEEMYRALLDLLVGSLDEWPYEMKEVFRSSLSLIQLHFSSLSVQSQNGFLDEILFKKFLCPQLYYVGRNALNMDQLSEEDQLGSLLSQMLLADVGGKSLPESLSLKNVRIEAERPKIVLLFDLLGVKSEQYVNLSEKEKLFENCKLRYRQCLDSCFEEGP